MQTKRYSLRSEFYDPQKIVLSHRPGEWDGAFGLAIAALFDSLLDGGALEVRVLRETDGGERQVIEGRALNYDPSTLELHFEDGDVVGLEDGGGVIAVSA